MLSATTSCCSCKRLAIIISALTLVSTFALYTISVMRMELFDRYYLQENATETAETEDLILESERHRVKKILFWNAWYHRTYYDFGVGEEPFRKYNCPETHCSTTSNRDELESADAVVICGRLLKWEEDPVVPPRRDPEQVYVYFNREAPVTQLGNNHRLKGVFNVTITYRRDSTIPFPYSVVVPRTVDAGDYVPVTLDDVRRKSRTRPISWMVSRCHKKGCVRHEYAEHLSRYIPIDVYGRCGNLSCPRQLGDTCMIMLERRYKFYLAFENAVCRDYVTEKAFRTLNYDIVPIVMGGADYGQILPPHSFIDVEDFDSPEQLADYLRYLNDNDTAYLEYFDWKRHYQVRSFETHEVLCKLCQLLHERRQFLVDFDLERWWDGMSGDNCILEDYRTKLMNHYGIDTSIEPIPRTHGKLLKQKHSKTTNKTDLSE